MKKIKKVQEEFNKLEKKQRYLLNILSIFGNEKSEVSVIFDFFFEREEYDELYELLFDLRDYGWIELEQNKFVLSSEAEEFIFENEPPNVKNSAPLIEIFMSRLQPPVQKRLDKEFEFMLLKFFSRISGESRNLAILYDFYGQYLSSIENHETATKFYKLAVELFERQGLVSVKLCDFYNHLSESYLQQRNYAQSLDAAFSSSHIAYSLQPKDIIVLVYTYSIIADVYFKQKKYKLAYDYNLKLLDIAEAKIDDNNLLAHLHFEASFSAFKNKLIKEAVHLLDKALEYAKKMPLQRQDHALIDKIKIQRQYMNLIKKIDLKFISWKLILILVLIIVLCFVFAFIFL